VTGILRCPGKNSPKNSFFIHNLNKAFLVFAPYIIVQGDLTKFTRKTSHKEHEEREDHKDRHQAHRAARCQLKICA
jgi:hypothetical protein